MFNFRKEHATVWNVNLVSYENILVFNKLKQNIYLSCCCWLAVIKNDKRISSKANLLQVFVSMWSNSGFSEHGAYDFGAGCIFFGKNGSQASNS